MRDFVSERNPDVIDSKDIYQLFPLHQEELFPFHQEDR